jgi:peptide/nickel transport system ATP-binding protein
MAGPVLTVHDLRVALGDVALVDGVDLELAAGERVGLIGESGSGKSLTALAVMGLLADELEASGSARLEGDELLGVPERTLARLRGDRVSMIFQEPMTALDPLMRVGQQVAEVVRLHRDATRGEARARAAELFMRVGLADPLEKLELYPHQLSGGQRQRVLIAMALACDPAVLIADEPTTALDVTVQAQILDLLGRLVAEQGAALLFITHDLAVIAGLCERVLVMHEGRIVERGATSEVFSAPQHPHTQALLAGTRALSDAPIRTPGEGPAADRPIVVEARGLVRDYALPRSSLRRPPPSVHALRGVDLTVRQGDRFGIVGESGSGKSTLARLLVALDQPTAGVVLFDGAEISGQNERDLRDLRRRAQIVFQDPLGSLDPRMRVRELLLEPLRSLALPGDHGARVRELLELVGLAPEAANRYQHQFSGGQRQRIAIARALAPGPSLLVADEPVSALDVSLRAQILDLLRTLTDELALTLVFISHDLSVVRYLCDRVAVMRDGEVVEVGATADVYGAPQHAYTRALLAAVPTL